jgi:hypothetical protein
VNKRTVTPRDDAAHAGASVPETAEVAADVDDAELLAARSKELALFSSVEVDAEDVAFLTRAHDETKALVCARKAGKECSFSEFYDEMCRIAPRATCSVPDLRLSKSATSASTSSSSSSGGRILGNLASPARPRNPGIAVMDSHSRAARITLRRLFSRFVEKTRAASSSSNTIEWEQWLRYLASKAFLDYKASKIQLTFDLSSQV